MPGVNLHNETKVGLLYALKGFTERVVKDMPLLVKQQSGDVTAPEPRPAAVYLARLPDMTSPTKKAPYILHQAVTGLDALGNENQGSGRAVRLVQQSSTVVRSVFCVYNPDEQEGGMTLLNLMEELRVALLMFPILDQVFELDIKEGVSQVVYPETGERGTAPYYLGEMVTTWKLPPVRRMDAARVIHGQPRSGSNSCGVPGLTALGAPQTDPMAAYRAETRTEKGTETDDQETE